jgi:hypothetical protein
MFSAIAPLVVQASGKPARHISLSIALTTIHPVQKPAVLNDRWLQIESDLKSERTAWQVRPLEEIRIHPQQSIISSATANRHARQT